MTSHPPPGNEVAPPDLTCLTDHSDGGAARGNEPWSLLSSAGFPAPNPQRERLEALSADQRSVAGWLLPSRSSPGFSVTMRVNSETSLNSWYTDANRT